MSPTGGTAPEPPSAFPWDEALALGLARLRWRPRDFWRATPRELMAAAGLTGAELYVGVDLSFSFDMTAVAFAFPEDDQLLCWIEYFKPLDTLEQAEKTDGVPYRLWIKNGSRRRYPPRRQARTPLPSLDDILAAEQSAA